MDYTDAVEVGLGITGSVCYVVTAVLSIVFLLRHREEHWRWLPAISVLVLPLLELVPESGWSDVRSQWHLAALTSLWGLWILVLALFLLRPGKGPLQTSLRVLFAVMGATTFVGCAAALYESWSFLHGQW